MIELTESLVEADRKLSEIMAENGYRREYLAKAAKCEARILQLKSEFDTLTLES